MSRLIKRIRLHQRLRSACAAGLAVAVLSVPGLARAEESIVIVNEQVPVETLARKDLRAIFTLRRRNWPDGSPITIYVLPDVSPAHQQFAKTRLRLYPYQLRQRWDRAVFSGTGPIPIEVADDAAMRAAIARDPGAIGYSDNANPAEGVKPVPPPSDAP